MDPATQPSEAPQLPGPFVQARSVSPPQAARSLSPQAARSLSPPGNLHARLWSVRGDRPPQQRDSLRSRSKEGRPGSRRNHRWLRNEELVGSLRRVLAKTGEDGAMLVDEDGNVRGVNTPPEQRHSAFYRLLELEGPENALEALTAAEGARETAQRPERAKGPQRLLEQQERAIRRAFSGSWAFINANEAVQELITQLESQATRAFSGWAREVGDADAEALLWCLLWDQETASLSTKTGAPPADEMAIVGLEPHERKVAHQLARVLGLHSSSKSRDEYGDSFGRSGLQDEKVVAMRVPRNRCGSEGPWSSPASVAQVLAVA